MIRETINTLRNDPRFAGISPHQITDLVKEVLKLKFNLCAVRVLPTVPDGFWYSKRTGQGIYVIDEGKELMRTLDDPNVTIHRSHVKLMMPPRLPKKVDEAVDYFPPISEKIIF